MKIKLSLLITFLCVETLEAVGLGITRDPTTKKFFHWSSVAYFEEDGPTVEKQLPSLAMAAYKEMAVDCDIRKIKVENRPASMAALLVGSDVYFSSSLRGGQFLVNPGREGSDYIQEGVAEEVGLAIVRCQETYKAEHRFSASCGEPLALQQYLVEHPKDPIKGLGKITTYGIVDLKTGETAVLNPCSLERGQWGCQILLDYVNIPRVGKEPDKPEEPSIKPKKTGKACFWDAPPS